MSWWIWDGRVGGEGQQPIEGAEDRRQVGAGCGHGLGECRSDDGVLAMIGRLLLPHRIFLVVAFRNLGLHHC